MPGLIGAIDARTGDLAETRSRMFGAAGYRRRQGERYQMAGQDWFADNLTTGIFASDPQGRAGSRFAALVDGEILNLAELTRQHLRDLPDPGHPNARLTALLDRCGLDIVAALNGLFAAVVWDQRDNQLSLIGDRFGFRSLYVYARDGTVLFGTEPKSITAALGAPPATDVAGATQLVAFGSHFGARTWLEGIEKVPPATILTFALDGARHQRQYWQYRYEAQRGRVDQAAYAARFGTLMDRAVERCMHGGRIGMFLSGGYDSRAVAAAIRPEHLPLTTFTFGVPQSRDVQIAPQLADRLGMRNVHLNPSEPVLAPLAQEIATRIDGTLPFAGLTSIYFHDTMCEHADIILTGFLGEFSGSHTWPELLLARSRTAGQQAIFRRFVEPGLARAKRVLTDAAYSAGEEALRSAFADSIEQCDNDHPLDLADAWNCVWLQPNSTYRSPVVDRDALEVRCPHMDADLVQWLLSIPPYARIEQRVYKRMIASQYPNVRDIPCANSMRPIEPRLWVEYPTMVARFVGRRVRKLADDMRGKPPPLDREIGNLDEDFRAEPALRDELLLPLVESGHLDPAVFAPDRVKRLAENHYAGREDNAALLSMLISLGLANRQLHGATDTTGAP